jgi:hypothetical protein
MDALNHWGESEDEDEFECDRCDRTFTSWEGCKQHMTALGHWYTDTCDTCNKRFVDRNAAEQHMDALNHRVEDEDDDEFECDKCDRTFGLWDACKQHMTALNHWYTDKCDTCDRRFVNKQAAEQHMDALEHRSSPYCKSCERYFQHPSDLFQHMNSPIHMRADPSIPPLHHRSDQLLFHVSRLSASLAQVAQQFLFHALHLSVLLLHQLRSSLQLCQPPIPPELHALTLLSSQHLPGLLSPLLR